jgi:hypothetical protein
MPLSKAVVRAARFLNIGQAELALILGISEASVTRLFAGDYELQSDRKEWDVSMLVIRTLQSLDALLGHGDQARAWLNSHNQALDDIPAALLESAEGLVRVLRYLEVHRGRF